MDLLRKREGVVLLKTAVSPIWGYASDSASASSVLGFRYTNELFDIRVRDDPDVEQLSDNLVLLRETITSGFDFDLIRVCCQFRGLPDAFSS